MITKAATTVLVAGVTPMIMREHFNGPGTTLYRSTYYKHRARAWAMAALIEDRGMGVTSDQQANGAAEKHGHPVTVSATITNTITNTRSTCPDAECRERHDVANNMTNIPHTSLAHHM